MNKIKISLLVVILLCLLVYVSANLRSTYSTNTDPTGTYTVKVSYKAYLSFIPMSIGSSSDKPGYVEIFDQGSKSLGEVPISMVQLAQLEWHEDGASLKSNGAEWNFEKGTCTYWDESGNYKMNCN